jgi:predicted nucleotidyltransferase
MHKSTDSAVIMGSAVLAEVVRRLVDAYHPCAIYLFGSRARGDYRPRSDHDLLVVVSNSAPKELQSSRKAYECLRGIGQAVDVLVCTQDYFSSRERVRTSVPARVMREGKVLYAA